MLALRFASSISAFAIVLCAPHCEAQQGKKPTPTADKFAMVYGAKIHYIEAGTGDPLILIHGLADDVAVWDSVISPLAARFRVVALDQIGFGRSDKPLLSYRFYENANVDLAFRQRVAAGDSYTISQVLDSMTHGEDVLDNRL